MSLGDDVFNKAQRLGASLNRPGLPLRSSGTYRRSLRGGPPDGRARPPDWNRHVGRDRRSGIDPPAAGARRGHVWIALAHHRRVIRRRARERRGRGRHTREFVPLSFPKAIGALTAAREIVDRLATGLIQVRIGRSYRGSRLDRRGIRGAPTCTVLPGSPRRVTVAGAGVGLTRALVEGDDLQDLGEHRLGTRGSGAHLPVRRQGVPASSIASPLELPVAATAFVGRVEELAAVTELTVREDTRLVTLTGPGGAGKTRLALQAATDASASFPDGTYWVPLAAVRDASLVLSTIAGRSASRKSWTATSRRPCWATYVAAGRCCSSTTWNTSSRTSPRSWTRSWRSRGQRCCSPVGSGSDLRRNGPGRSRRSPRPTAPRCSSSGPAASAHRPRMCRPSGSCVRASTDYRSRSSWRPRGRRSSRPSSSSSASGNDSTCSRHLVARSTPADAAGDDRLVVPPPRRTRAPAVRAPVGLRRRRDV